MKKVDHIRSIFDLVMNYGYNDDKQDSISIYTRDKMENTVYVKKLDVNLGNIDSVAITALESDFSDACDADVRIAFLDKKIGKRVILYANEVETSVLEKIKRGLYESLIDDLNNGKRHLK